MALDKYDPHADLPGRAVFVGKAEQPFIGVPMTAEIDAAVTAFANSQSESVPEALRVLFMKALYG